MANFIFVKLRSAPIEYNMKYQKTPQKYLYSIFYTSKLYKSRSCFGAHTIYHRSRFILVYISRTILIGFLAGLIACHVALHFYLDGHLK